MGASTSKDNVRDSNAYQQILKRGEAGYAEGGYFGGAEDATPASSLREYQRSLAAEAKERVVRGIARALKNADISVDPDADLATIVGQLKKALPNTANGDSLDSGAAADICLTVARVLNDEFTPGASASESLVDTSMAPAEVCRAVTELVYSMATGLQTEFLDVHRSVEETLRNLEVLSGVMEETHSVISKSAGAKDPSGKLLDMQELYTRAQSEAKRQRLLLQGFLDVTLAPTLRELEAAMSEASEAKSMIKKLKLVPGTSEFADRLAEAISGLGTVAAVAARVDKALREVGLKAEEYLAADDFAAFQAMTDARFDEVAKGDGDLLKFFKAVEVLRKNFDRREDIREKASAAAMPAVAVGGDSFSDAALTKVDKRVREQEKARAMIVKDFMRRSGKEYAAILEAVGKIGPQLGKNIPLSDQLNALRDALERLQSTREGALRIELALIGFYRNAASRQKREAFLAALRLVRDVLAELASMDLYRGEGAALFGQLRDAIESHIRTIDTYSDIVQKKYGGEAEPVTGGDDDAAVVPGPCSCPAEEVLGGDPFELENLPEMARSAYDLEKGINDFAYFAYVAQVRENMSRTSSELAAYGENYDEVLGEAVAARIRQEKAKASNDDFTRAQVKCKVEFYRALQAIDLYLKAFTEGIVASPEDVADIKRVIDGVDVIARWYDEKTGDELALAFEDMGDGVGGDVVKGAAGDHYYDKKAAVAAASNTDAAKQLTGDDKQRVESAQKRVKAALESFQALKNLVNAFFRIGEKFGGKDLRRGLFMTPTQIYKALLDYIRCSAFSGEREGGAVVGAAGNDSVLRLLRIAAQTVKVGVAIDADLAAINAAADKAPADMPSGGSAPVQAIDAATLPLERDIAARLTQGVITTSAKVTYDGILKNAMQLMGGGTEGAATSARMADATGVNDFTVENRYFAFALKAMVAKIFTVIGVYDLFERPNPVNELTPTRMIIGGYGAEPAPQVIPEAAELYFRLPRLVEFYHELFKVQGAAAVQISFLPEVEGVFSGLIRLIFVKAIGNAQVNGNYSESEMHTLIREINGVYEHFRGSAGKQGVTKEAIAAFVVEINRRYGVVRAADYKKMMDLLQSTAYGSNLPEAALNDTNYAILPGEGEADFDRRAPSDRYLSAAGPASGAVASKAAEFEIDTQFGDGSKWQMLQDFRRKIETMLGEVSGRDFTRYSFRTLIRRGEDQIRKAGEGADRLEVVKRLVQGSSDLGSIDTEKAYMFHETVVVGLNLLTAIYNILRRARTAAEPILGVAERDAAAADSAGAMRQLLVLVMDLTTSMPGLVEARFPNTASSQLYLDFSGVRSLVQGLMADVRGFLDAFRGSMSKEIIARYEGSAGDANAATYYGLQQVLIDGMIVGVPGAREDENQTLEALSRGLDRSFTLLVDKEIDFSGVIAELVYFGEADPSGGNTLITGGNAVVPLGKLIAAQRPGNDPAPDGVRLDLWNESNDRLYKNNARDSLMLTFNQLIVKYIKATYDTSTAKIYRPLIESFAQGVFSRSVMTSDAAFNDIVDVWRAPDAVPTSSDALLKSIALMLQRIMVDTNPRTQMSDHLIATLSELPLFILEGFRANLPYFVQLFNLLQARGEFLKRVMTDTRMMVGADAASSEARRSEVATLIDAINSGCYALSGSAGQVLRELSDEPLYLEVSQNSIADYRARYDGRTPVMPFSSALNFLRDNAALERFMPTKASGDPDFKMLYGSRKLLGRTEDFGLTDAPGVREALLKFNASAGARDQIAENDFATFLGRSVGALRFFVRATRFAAIAGNTGGLATAAGAPLAAGLNADRSVYGAKKSVNEVLSLTESSSPDREARKISDLIGAAAGPTEASTGNDRSSERIVNLIDMNIMPVNIHALMRGIPFAPLYNYAYTCEEGAARMYGTSAEAIQGKAFGGAGDQRVANTREAFLKLLEDPYAPAAAAFSPDSNADNMDARFAVDRIFRGDDTLQMGRPKFSSDQLYNKVLLKSLVPRRGQPEVGARDAREDRYRKLLSVFKGGEAKATTLRVKDVPAGESTRRFDTTLVRNLFFVSNVLRLVRAKLNRELTQYRTVIASGHSAVDPAVTEFSTSGPSTSNNFGPYEAVADRRYNSDLS